MLDKSNILNNIIVIYLQKIISMPSQSTENYLKALFILVNEKSDLTITNLSKKLNVTLPSANSMIKRLQEKGWVEYQKYKPLRFSKKGYVMAAQIVRKHRLTEMFLTEKMGFGWEEVHSIAEQIEHIQSPKLFDRMDELLGFPTVDPHGSPIPDKEGNLKRKSYQVLSEISPGNKVVLRALKESSTDFLLFLNKHQLTLDTVIDIIDKEEFDGSMVLKYHGVDRVIFSATACDRLLVDIEVV
jgi:DtxR family Mn-dependent transcriptional regulator